MTDANLELDWETRSDIDLTRYGVYRYVESPHTEALLASYSFDGGKTIRRWRKGQPCPQDIAEHVAAGGMITAHNAAFERLIWWFIMSARHGWPRPALEQFRCTASTAAAMSLPRDLDGLGAALNLAVQKSKDGKHLIKRHSLPQGWGGGAPIWDEDPASLDRFHDYCDDDVRTEAGADARLIPFSTEEQAVYVLNERINDRGVRLDVKSARATLKLIERAKAHLDREMRLVTGGYVKACSNVGELLAWVKSHGVEIGTVQKEEIEELLELDHLPGDRHSSEDLIEHGAVRRALELRQEAAKTSVSKIPKMLDRVCADGRIRGVYVHQGAGQTGRFSSRGVQAHNMPKYRKVFEDAIKLSNGKTTAPRLSTLFGALRTGDPEWLHFLYGPTLGRPLHLVSDAIRGFLLARPGYDLLDADYSSIEGRMAAWFAGEDWKLDAYRALDAGTGHGIYEMTAAGIYGIPVEQVGKHVHRPVGKVAELALGYQGGVGALSKMARQNKLKLHKVFESVWESAPEGRRERAVKRFDGQLKRNDEAIQRLGREGWLAAELIKIGWRTSHPRIEAAWRLLEEAATNAVTMPGEVFSTCRVSYVVRHGFLWCLLPSGRCLAYGAPKFRETEAPWADKSVPKGEREMKLSLTARGVDSQSGKWLRTPIYGGSLFNNVVQGTARDILVNGMMKAEAAGYPLILHTHDEMVAEVPRGFGDVGDFERLICELPAWAEGLPIAASGWRGKRYRKD